MTTFWDRFSAIADKNAERIAIEDGARVITYDDLLKKASAVGTALRLKSCGPETIVALNMEKSADYIVAMLGCWHAGAAFVPLPPSLPPERRDFILEQADILHVIDNAFAQNATGRSAAQNITPQTLAYIIYTSGSTGAPKGVMIEHAGILPLADAQIAAFGLAPGKRSLFYLSILFDASVSDICTALLSGATLVLPSAAMMKDGAALISGLHDSAITHMDIPPSLLKAINPQDMPKSLETIVIGGEACPVETVKLWAGHFNVVNVYGPTEATVCTSLARCDAPTWDKPIIGTPLPGVTYTILNDTESLSDEGQLYISGACLARGYLKAPALTADKFPMIGGKRFYKTGDRVRKHTDGSIEFLGRIDRQFKINGQLVEPDEIEARLLSHPTVQRAAVIKENGRLIAFVQGQGHASELTGYLKNSLPAWMIPRDIFFPDTWPLTATGKTDRARLLKPQSQVKRVMPRDAAEKKIWNLWRDILKHSDFGVTDDFFSVGGDSLDIIRLTLQADRQGIPLGVETIAQCRTIEHMAQKMTAPAPSESCDWLKQDVTPDDNWQDLFTRAEQRPGTESKNPSCILLTGAAGFLGGWVLHELLSKTTATIVCLLRAENNDAARRRIEKKLAQFGKNLFEDRIKALCGDLSQPCLGLNQDTWAELSEQTDAVYHCAAQVNMALPYDDLRSSNVAATQEILRLCCTGRRKTLHHASTLSVFVSTDQNTGRLLESDRLEMTTKVFGGYAQTKWAAEWMLLQVPAKVCDIRHYRFGLITGDIKNGIGADHDFLSMFARGISSLRLAPAEWDEKLFVDITPVDHAASAMVHLSLNSSAGIYHIANSESLSLGRLLAAIERQKGAITRLPAARFQEVADNLALTTEESAACLGLARCFPETFARNRTMDLFQATGVIFDTANSAGLTCPASSDELLDKYMRHAFRNDRSVIKIRLFGPESTGKSTLTEHLAQHYKTSFVAEYAKELIAAQNGRINAEDIPTIARGQAQREKEMTLRANGILFCDTDLITTTIWSDRLFGTCPEWIRDAAEAQDYALTLLLDIDTPWVDDIHRFLPNERTSFFQKCRAELDARGLPYVIISGNWEDRLKKAITAVDNLVESRNQKCA